MKKFNINRKHGILKISMFIAMLLMSLSQVSAGNAYWGDLIRPDATLMVGEETPIVVEMKNSEEFSVYMITLSINVRHAESGEIVFTYADFLDELPPLATQVINSEPFMWLVEKPGLYLIELSLFGENDNNPDDNEAIFELMINSPMEFEFPVFIEQIDFTNEWQFPNSSAGYLNITYEPQTDVRYVNMYARRNPDDEPVWIMKNFPLLPFEEEQTIAYCINFRDLGFVDGEDVTGFEVFQTVDLDYISTAEFPEIWQYLPVENTEYNVGVSNPVDPEFRLDPIYVDYEIELGYKTIWDYRGCKMPNIDLDGVNHPSSPTYAGDVNACGPAAAANSMQWLADSNSHIKDNGSLREKMEELSKMMGRARGAGVTTRQLIKGKLAFIDKHKLPIHVKFQSYFENTDDIESPDTTYSHTAENKNSSANKPPSWAWLLSEFQKGEDVEMMFGWYDSSGTRHGGHWVTVTGMSDVGTAKGLYFKDDDVQGTSGGTRQKYVNWVEGPNGWSRLTGFTGPNSNCWVESVVSESYDPSIKFDKIKPTIKKTTQKGGAPPTNTKSILKIEFPASDEIKYINFVALGTDGDEFWFARNVMLPPFDRDQTINVWWDMADLGYTKENLPDEIAIYYELGFDPNFTSDNNDFFRLDVVEEIIYFGNGAIDAAASKDMTLVSDYYPTFEEPQVVKWVYRGCDVPNVDLDSTNNNPETTKGYAGDMNACGPAAAANSLHWLETTIEELDSTSTLREKLVELSEMMKRENNEGVTTEDFLKAKQEFVDKHKLPIKVKFQSYKLDTNDIDSPNDEYGHDIDNHNASNNAIPQWDWLVQEMEHGEDVEIEYGYYDKTGKRVGGHWITVTGVYQINGARGIYYKHDLRQDSAGGTQQDFVNWIDTGSDSYLGQLSSSEYTCWIETIASESYDPSVTFDNIKLKVKTFENKGKAVVSPTKACIEVEFPASETASYLNVYAKTIDNTEFWIVRNFMLPAFDRTQTIDVWWDMADLGYTEDVLPKQFEINYNTIYNGLCNSKFFGGEAEIEVITYGIGSVETDPPVMKYAVDRAYPVYKSEPNPNKVYRGCNMPNIDLDSAKNNPGFVPGYAGDKNACGPAAAANSLHWLETTVEKLDSTSTIRQKLIELSKMMKRSDNGGVTTDNFLKAKQEFVDKHKLPIRVKFQSFKFDTNNIPSPNPDYGHAIDNRNNKNKQSPAWDWLMAEMKHGEDIELEYGYYDSTGTRKGGHWVTVSGVSEVGGVRGVYFKHDRRQDSAGGTKQEFVNWKDTLGYSYLSQISSANSTCWIETIASESYDSTVTFTGVSENIERRFKMNVYENPSSVNSTINIVFEIPNDAYARVSISDMQGREVALINNKMFLTGTNTVIWDGHDSSGQTISAGIYFVVIRSGGAEETVKIIRR